jgi:DNA-directed RNA polymerase subunit M/transcription elongation factor TFIIS
MRFCSNCDNMYYLKMAGEDEATAADTLVYYCRHCGHEDSGGTDGACALQTTLHSQKQQYTHAVNAHTREDPTLPRTTSIRCPVATCESNQADGDDKREVVYLRYDDTSMRYLYICGSCGTMWKTSDRD